MKLLFLLLSSWTVLAAPCDKKADPKRAMLFLNTNYSTLELKAAEAEACKLGLTFVRMPDISDEMMIRMDQLKKKVDSLNWEKKKQCKSQSSSCSELDEKIKIATADVSKLLAETPKFFKNDLDRKLAELSAKDIAIATAVFSGHNGGGFVEGSTGRVSKTNFFTSMNKSYGNKPKLKAQLESVLLWGCYTATPEEILAWKASFPELKILAGFNGIAPSNERAESANILTDLLNKQPKMINQKIDKDLLKIVRSIEDINEVHSGIYVNACSSEYYYSRDYNGESFKTFEQMKKCDTASLQNNLARFNEFYSGDRPHNEIEVRKVYDYARKFDHCFTEGHPLDGNHVALLVFFPAVKYNFGNVFSDLTKNAQKEFLNLRKALPKDLQAVYDNVAKSFFFPTPENLQKADRKAILQNIALMDPLIRNSFVNSSPQIRNSMKNLIELQNKMENYLHLLKPSCMDFLEWHYQQPNFRPSANC